MRHRGEAAAAEGYALGVHPAGVWLFLVRRVLDWIELHYGRHARLEAESRARKNADLLLKTAKGARNRRGCGRGRIVIRPGGGSVTAWQTFFANDVHPKRLEADLASMRKRVDVLAAKRAEAKAVFDQAVSERQSFLLEGDLSNERAGGRLQKAVDAAASRVTGFDGALLALQTQLDDVEMKLRAENEAVERELVASEVEATIKDIETRLQPWLENTRAFIAALAPLDHLSFETQQCREFIAKLAGEVELALAVHLPDLRRYATGIRECHMLTPRFPRPEPEVLDLKAHVVTPTSPGEEVQTWFAIKPLRWKECSESFIAPEHVVVDLNSEVLPPSDLPPGFERLPVVPSAY
jgi:hypothetical protein